MTFQGTPPGFHAEDMSRRTVALRPTLDLTPLQIECIRQMRRKKMEAPEIAATLELDLDKVERAMLAMRTPKPDRRRRSLNVTLEAAAFVDSEKRPGEAGWKAVDRLVDELLTRRRAAGGRA
ncbi:hypothetical protein [Roseomonas indoligenes]|uniref:Uncharacterized protein n=1 Tax=Roseomonas indoligenes TaxID=2820811 RepID=A0A940MWP0_9PROT|nr:hypothetical protein [Pararoseomonas indoligenes]MBP0493058.1 hypothetical protein [Pararoseomonas indoligenes]